MEKLGLGLSFDNLDQSLDKLQHFDDDNNDFMDMGMGMDIDTVIDTVIDTDIDIDMNTENMPESTSSDNFGNISFISEHNSFMNSSDEEDDNIIYLFPTNTSSINYSILLVYSNFLLDNMSSFPEKLHDNFWKYFIERAEEYIKFATSSHNHFSYWNIVAVCFFCSVVKFSVPILIEEIIEFNVKITKERLFKSGKKIFMIEGYYGKLTHTQKIFLVMRLKQSELPIDIQNCMNISTNEKEIISEILLDVDKLFPEIEEYLRMIIEFMSFTSEFQEEKENIYFNSCMRCACQFFRRENTLWLREICIKFRKK